MNFRELISKLDKIEEAADPQKYADAQQMMANLEKAAQYTGDDEIVRNRMGLPPKLPPIEQWDGKMPAPIGKPDWFARLTSLGKATDDQATAVKQNAAISTSRDFIDKNLAKLQDLVAKLSASGAVKESDEYSFSLAKELVESFDYKQTDEGFGSVASKIIPGAGLALGAYDAYNRAKAGDYTGAALSGGAGLASLVPGLGTAAALGLTGAQIGRDKAKTGEFLPDYDKIAAANTPGVTQSGQKANPVKAMQKELGVADDGIIGKDTRTAMSKNPKVAAKYGFGPDGKPLKESKTEGERIADLKNRLAEIERQELNEAPWDALLKGGKAALDWGKGAMAGLKGGAAASNVASGAANLGKAGDKGLAAAQAVKGAGTAVKSGAGKAAGAAKANPIKTAAGAAAVGGAVGYGATKLASQGNTAPAKPQQSGQAAAPANAATPAATPNAPAAPAAPAGPTPEQQDLIKQIQAVMGQLADVEEQGVIKALGDAQAAIDKASKPAAPAAPAASGPSPEATAAAAVPGEKRTPQEVQASLDLKNFNG